MGYIETVTYLLTNGIQLDVAIEWAAELVGIRESDETERID